MAANTKIQFRRGYSTSYNGSPILGRPTPLASGFKWSAETILSEGEIGYEVDTGKFKIGKVIDGTLGSWSSLPYAGGSELIANSGIGYTLDSSANAYTLYSFITGVAGGQEGITFETLPLSSLLNDASATGTYYRIGLSSKLENLHDSYFTFDTNLLASNDAPGGTGIVVSGYNNSTIALNPNGGTVTASGIDIRNLTAPITVTEAVGGLAKGITLTSSSGITEVLRTILEKVFEPSQEPPTFTISFAGSPTTTVEAGTSTNLTINANFNQGVVRGTGIGAGWVTDGNQGVRAGAATSYTINGTVMGLTASRNIGSVIAVDGATTYNGSNSTVTYGAGIVPKNSLGVNSTSVTQLQGNTIPASNNLSFTGRRNLFYGTSTSVLEPPSSGFIRTLTPILNPSSSTAFTISVPTGTRTVIVAVPSGAGYEAVANNTFNVQNNLTQLAVTFASTGINIPAANGYAPTGYKVWYLVNNGPTSEPVTYNVSLS